MNHPLTTSYVLLVLADVLWDRQDWCGSMDAGEEAYAIHRELLGEDHAQTQGARGRIARVLDP